MDPVRFLDLAKLLKGGTASAEMCRTAIGRAYSAAFNVGVEALLDIGIQPSQSPSGHGELRHCLGAWNLEFIPNAAFGRNQKGIQDSKFQIQDPENHSLLNSEY